MTLRITAIEAGGFAPVGSPDPLAIPDFLRREFELPAFLPTPHRKQVRAMLAEAAAQLAHMERRQ